MKVVEEPFRRRCHRLSAAHVVGQQPVGLVQHAAVVLEARKDFSRTPPSRIDAKACSERVSTLFEPLDAEQLVTQRPRGLRRLAQEWWKHANCQRSFGLDGCSVQKKTDSTD